MDDNNTLKGEFILNGSDPTTNKVEGENSASTTKAHLSEVKSSPHFYSSFFRNPDGVSFAEQEADENILLLLRRHFVTNVPWITAAILLLILPVTFPFFITFFPFPVPSNHVITLYLAFYYLVIFGFVLINFTLWYFNVGLITSIHVVDIDLSGILYRQISQTKKQKIEDVTYKQSGFIRSLFNYGDVLVQTAGEEENIEYDRVPHPSIVAEIITELSEEA